MMIYTLYIYYSKHETSNLEDFEMTCNYCYGESMTAQKKPLKPPIVKDKRTAQK